MSNQRPHTRVNTTPLLSVLMPAYREEHVILALVEDLLHQADFAERKNPEHRLEIVIASDDLMDYSALLPSDQRLVFCEPKLQTGPANARTRALDKASGRFVLAIDADDSVSSMFIPQVFTATQTRSAFAVRANYIKNGEVVRRLEVDTLTQENFIAYSGSVPVVFPRNWLSAYPNVVAEDAVSVVNTLHKAGGSLDVIDAEYNITTHIESFCARIGSQFASLYAHHRDNVKEIARVAGNPQIEGLLAELFDGRIEVNAAFEKSMRQELGLDYHEFIVSRNLKKVRLVPEISRLQSSL